MSVILTPTRPPRLSRVRGVSCCLNTEIDSKQTLNNQLQLAILRLKTVDLPQLVERAVEPYKAELNNLSQTVKILREDNHRLQQQIEINRDNLVKLEGQSRRDNLKFFGIRESSYETKFDCKRYILEILEDSNIYLNPKAIESAHRVGPKQQHRERPIIVKCFHREEKELIVSKAAHIWNITRIRVEEDFATKIEADRKILKPIFLAANKSTNQNGKKEYRANLTLDKLRVDNKVYTVNNLETLPIKLQPQNLSTITKGNTTAFFTKDSPLSNHHIAKQKINNHVYNCNEQFYMSEKALYFRDHATAEAILKEQSPGKQKTLGNNIRNFNQAQWEEKSLVIMEQGIRAKFTQNSKLQNFLLQTGTTQLLEANPKDSFWGVGMSIRNSKIWIKNSWVPTATNHLGRLLHELRRDLRPEQSNVEMSSNDTQC